MLDIINVTLFYQNVKVALTDYVQIVTKYVKSMQMVFESTYMDPHVIIKWSL